ncbi:hypothetical protein PSTT_12469 [Puccinia striiformis]|uniref:Uncharacterized protein n=1 Tax=Puccinia striiformis TaxID=27350 RepID=A0A2S4UVV1_9BASI|nr:hypothetical protein PSTT_12469 [Puccinia striiformis]
MANQSVTPSTVAERTPAATGLPINTNTGINSTHQTNISTSSTPLRTQTSALPTATTSVQSSPVSQWIPPATSASSRAHRMIKDTLLAQAPRIPTVNHPANHTRLLDTAKETRLNPIRPSLVHLGRYFQPEVAHQYSTGNPTTDRELH